MEPDTVLAAWEEPRLNSSGLPRPLLITIITSGLILAALFGLAGWYWQSLTYYLAAAGVMAIGLFLISQGRAVQPSRQIQLTASSLVIGRRAFPLDELAGFWLNEENGWVLVNIEHQRPTPFPLTFFYPSADSSTVRSLLLQVLPEVEPRQRNGADRLGQLFRF